MYINLTWNCRVCGSGFSLFDVRFLAELYYFEVNWPTILCENREMEHIFKIKLECQNSYNIYYCEILQMVILHNAIKTIQNGVFMFFEKRMKTCFFKKKTKNATLKKQEGWNFLKTPGFYQPWLSFNPFCDFPLIALSGTTDDTISLIGRAPYI